MTTDPTTPSAGTDMRPPWEPPLASGEVEHLTGALDRLRATFRWKVDGLAEAGLRANFSGLDQEIHSAWPDGRHANLRRVLFDLVEEYGRHTGHADLLREFVDGRVGEDPPEEWRPVSGDYRFH